MKFFSTRNRESIVDFKGAIFEGLAPDGGLYLPAGKPDLEKIIRKFVVNIEKDNIELYRDVVRDVSNALLTPEIGEERIKQISEKAVKFAPLLRPLDERISLLELFHGPTCAFKDFGASFLASSMENLLEDENSRAVILVATSGDTGSAVARAFYRKKNIDVVILYPSGRVSYLQEKQLTTLGENIIALEVRGAFDDCQRLVKEAFMDRELSGKINLTSANSINLGRLLPQSYYYVFGYLKTISDRGMSDIGPNFDRATATGSDIVFCVPSGNFGNLTAGVLAWEWGLPVRQFIAATNVNDVVPEYLNTGIFSPRASVKTLSNAMDVGNPSNFERLRVIFNDDVNKMREMLYGESVSDEDTLVGIREVYEKYGVLVDPHTAVGYVAARRYLRAMEKGSSANFPIGVVILATAHPGKFSDTVKRATGVEPELPETLREVMNKEKRSVVIEPDISDLKSFLLKHF